MGHEAAQKRNLYSVSICFLVDDIVRSAEYYRDVFGFSFERYWGEPPCFVMLQRGGVEFFLSSNGRNGHVRPNHVAHPDFTWDAYVRCHDVDALYDEFKRRGAHITSEPRVASYQMKEFEVKDCNGYILCFAQNVSAAA